MDTDISGRKSLSYLDIKEESEGFHFKISSAILSISTITLKRKIITGTNISVFHSQSIL